MGEWGIVLALWAMVGAVIVPDIQKRRKNDRQLLAAIILGGPIIWSCALIAVIWEWLR